MGNDYLSELDSGASISLITGRVSLKLNIVGAQGINTGNSTSSTTFLIKAVKSELPHLSLTPAVVPVTFHFKELRVLETFHT